MRSIPVQARQRTQAQFRMVRPRDPARNTSASLTKGSEYVFDANALNAAKEWQPDAYRLSRLVGQIGKIHHVTANTVAACELRPIYTDPVTGDESTLSEILNPAEGTEIDPDLLRQAEAVKRTHDSFVAPIGGQRELLRKFALNIRIGGETFLVATPALDKDESELIPTEDSPELLWEFLSPLEIDPDRFGDIQRKRTGVGFTGMETIGESNYIARAWQSDPEFSEQPDCAMRRVIPDARQYVKLRDVIDSAANSRIPAGIIKVPEGLDAVGSPQDEDDPDEQGALPFTEALFRHIQAPFEDPTSGSRLVPLAAVGDPDDLKELQKLDLGDEQNAEWASALRSEVLKSIAQILDAPPEMMEGKGEVNHWTGYSIDAEFNGRHVIPLGEFGAVFCTVSYLQPMLEKYEQLTDSESANWTYLFDSSNITARADRGVTAIRLGERDLLSSEAQVIANGFSVSDMPDEEELRVQRLIRIIQGAPSLAPQLLPLVPGFEDVVLVSPATGAGPPDGPVTPSGPPGAGDEPTGQSGGDPESGGGEPPNPSASPSVPGSPNADAALVGVLLGEADAIIERALEKAGARALSRINLRKIDSKKLPAADRLRNKDKRQALALLSESDMRALDVTPESLLDGAWDEFILKAQGLVQPWVVAKTGTNGSVSVETARSVANDMAAKLQSLTLSDRGTRSYDDGLRVPPMLIVSSLEEIAPVVGW